ncbi:serine hydrolase domain-containing protein [Planctomicrobium sp. SH527]|uniref:serine hydrolase domain-containing protein n=1 Tax=Planctomicrobium sp. SH527 TaxID=3448123 RepID=UPI003F5B750A
MSIRSFLSTLCLLVVSIQFVIATQSVKADAPAGIPGVDELIEAGIQEKKIPGAVVLIGTKDQILHRKAYGARQILPTEEPNVMETIYDLASLTKPVATATSVMLLMEQGKIDINAPVTNYLPEFTSHGKDKITVHHLLTHTSGLIADNHIRDYQQGREEAWKRICALKLVAPPEEKFIYSDVGFITLGILVERVSGTPLNEFVQQNLFAPLKMADSAYQPDPSLVGRIAPQNQEKDRWIRGTVHDPRASLMGGVAGHAGTFATADDLSRYARMILNNGSLDGVQILAPTTVAAMAKSHPVPGNGVRTWGWDRKTGYSGNRGQGMSEMAMGHGGFTGTGLWIDPELDLYVIVLSNRLHPEGKGAVNKIIGKIGTAAVNSVKQSKVSAK